MPMLVRELLALYAAGRQRASLPRVTPYRDYLAWLAAAGSRGGACGLARGAGRLEEGTRLAPRRGRPRRRVVPEQIVLSSSRAARARRCTRAARERR